LEPTGVSIVSDIDDTIKFTDVGNRRRMLQNTFLRPFATIEGMAPRYQQWAAENAAFHYVSSSPWQLFAPLEQWRRAAGFPEGTFHLRQFRLGVHMLRRLLRIRRHGKARVIHDLLERFPQRQFVLIGDSGERDPEIYGALARRFPQVSAIWIRELAHRPMGAERLGKAFRQLDRGRCRVFERAAELPQELAEFCGSPVAV
jgi:phosphatidate phosphatase APP1